jgi:enterochelin esterase-like enzyme
MRRGLQPILVLAVTVLVAFLPGPLSTAREPYLAVAAGGTTAGQIPIAAVDPAPPATPSPGGRSGTARFESAALGRVMPYLVYLPPGYDAHPAARYPVLYMLHGMGGDERQWQRLGLLTAAERLIATGEIPPMIIVMPRGDQAYWMDHAGNGPRWGRFVVTELVDDVDIHYRTIADRDHRAIGGVSMGGHGALQLALNNPDRFATVGSHSLVLRRHSEAPAYFGDASWFAAHDPVSLVQQRPDAARRLSLWIDVGREDGWSGRDEAFHAQLVAAGSAHLWQEWPGGHDDAYWSAHLDDYLTYYGDRFRAGGLSATSSPAQGNPVRAMRTLPDSRRIEPD